MNNFKLVMLVAAISILTACGGAEERKEVYLEKARQSLEAGDLDKARVELKNVLQIDPKDARAHFQLGEIFDQKKEYEKAFRNYSKAVELDPENLEFQAKIGTYQLMLAGNIDAASEIRDLILAKDAVNVDGLLLKAAILLKQNDKNGAEKISQEIFSANVNHVHNALFLSSIYLRDKKYDDAINVLKACVNENPNERPLLNMLAEAYLQAGKYGLAENIYKTAIENKPEVFTNYLKLAVFYKITNNLAKSEEVLRQAIMADKKDSERVLALIDFLQQTKGNQAAIDELRNVVEDYPKEGSYRIKLAKTYVADGNSDDAEQVLKLAISDFSEESVGVKARVELAKIYIQDKNIDAASSIIHEAVKISPNDAEVNFVYGKIQVINKDYEGAIISLRMVIKDYPENMMAYFLLSVSHSAIEQNAQADEIINLAYENNKANAEGLITLANYLVRNKNDGFLEKVVDHYLSLDGNNYEMLSYKAQLLSEKRMYSEIKPYAMKMVELYPDMPNGYVYSASYMLEEKNRNETIAMLENGYNEVDENARILELLVLLYMSDKKFELAENKVKAAIHENGETAELFSLLARVQWLSDKKEFAEANLIKANTIKPDWDEPYIYLADIYVSQKSNKKAIEILQKGLDKVNNNYKLSLALAKIYEELSDFNAAIKTYSDAHEKHTDDIVLMNNLAVLLSEHRTDATSLERAKVLADKLKNIDQPVLLDTAGWVYYKIGNYAEAVSVLKSVIEKSPDVPVFNYHYGMALYKAGDEKTAKTYLSNSLVSNTNFRGKEEAEAYLAKLK